MNKICSNNFLSFLFSSKTANTNGIPSVTNGYVSKSKNVAIPPITKNNNDT